MSNFISKDGIILYVLYIGALQTLSYLKSEDNNKKEEEKPEVNYLGYELDSDYDNDTIFLNNLNEKIKKFFEKKYPDEIEDIYEENLYNNKQENSKIIGVHENVIRFYADNVFDGNLFTNYNKIFQVEYITPNSKEKKIFSSNILKVLNNNLLLLNESFTLDKLFYIKKSNKNKNIKKRYKKKK